MAKAFRTNLPAPPPPVEVTLVLSEAEARTLVATLRLVGGSPDRSPRKHTAAILDVLYPVLNVDQHAVHVVSESKLARGGIVFEDCR